MGLAGTGKTILGRRLQEKLKAAYFNADEVALCSAIGSSLPRLETDKPCVCHVWQILQ